LIEKSTFFGKKNKIKSPGSLDEGTSCSTRANTAEREGIAAAVLHCVVMNA